MGGQDPPTVTAANLRQKRCIIFEIRVDLLENLFFLFRQQPQTLFGGAKKTSLKEVFLVGFCAVWHFADLERMVNRKEKIKI